MVDAISGTNKVEEVGHDVTNSADVKGRRI